MADTNLEVEYACNADGDHTAPMSECSESRVQTFDTDLQRQHFIAECTYVYNLDIALGNKINAGTPNPVLDCLEENYV